MVINYCCENMVEPDLFSFIKENDFTGLKLRLLFFWGKHPHTKFDMDCIANFLDITRYHLRDIIKDLISKGVIDEQYCSNGTAHYSLNHENEKTKYIDELARLDWSVLNSMLGAIEREALPV
ncbi:MAG: hypothetical protein ABSB31_03940 [Dehalococcoidia bacterium]